MPVSQSPPKVTRKRTVLNLVFRGEKSAEFGRYAEGREFLDPDACRVIVPLDRWLEMGAPQRVTVAIWPGDRQDLLEAEDFPK